MHVTRFIKRKKIWLFSGTVLIVMALGGCSDTQHKKQNRLQFASSPYLKEHADNPVNWYEWGAEALNKAKQENKPLLISIGYAACHWCHEMGRESFMDTAVARVMNENFICQDISILNFEYKANIINPGARPPCIL